VPAIVRTNDPDWLMPTAPDPSTVVRTRIGGPVRQLVTDDAELQDPGHAIPAELWTAVEAGALERERMLDPRRRSAAPRTAVDRTIRARSHGGTMQGGPRLAVLHSAETPLRAGYAYSIAANWFATRATTSAHLMLDPVETIRLLPDNVVAYAVGPRANGFTWNVEQAGYAHLGTRQWLSDPLGLAQMRRVAIEMRELRDRWDMPIRRATDAQIIAAARGELQRAGWCEHDDIRRVLGGTTHTDPGDYPWGDLLDLTTEDDMAQFTEQHADMLEDLHYGLRRPVILGVTLSTAQRELLERARATDGSAPTTATDADMLEDAERPVAGWTDGQVELLAADLLEQLTPEQRAQLARHLS
jgi:hypothetical protein